MSPPRGFKITFFLPDGAPDGMKIVEKSNWTGRAIVCPRGKFGDLKERPEFSKTGVYLLIGQDNPDDLSAVYIGEGDPVGDRLAQHQKTKDFWSFVVFFTSKDENLNKAHVQYLEASLIQLATEAKRCKLDNQNSPTKPSLSEADVAEMEEFLAQMLLIYPTLGVSIFQRPQAMPKKAEVVSPKEEHAEVSAPALLFTRSAGLKAAGYEAPNGFVVQAGSQAAVAPSPSLATPHRALRDSLIANGILRSDGDHLTFTEDYLFDSPSAPASLILGYSANGRTTWKDASLRTLKEIQGG